MVEIINFSYLSPFQPVRNTLAVIELRGDFIDKGGFLPKDDIFENERCKYSFERLYSAVPTAFILSAYFQAKSIQSGYEEFVCDEFL